MAAPPRQALRIADEIPMAEAVLLGMKIISIREGHIDYRVGEEVFIVCLEQGWCAVADLVCSRHTTLRHVRPIELFADGFADLDQALEALRRFYPDLTLDSEVTVVGWDHIRGSSVDDFLGQR